MTLSRGICSEPIPMIIMTSKVPSSRNHRDDPNHGSSDEKRQQLKHIDRETHQQTRRKEGGKTPSHSNKEAAISCRRSRRCSPPNEAFFGKTKRIDDWKIKTAA